MKKLNLTFIFCLTVFFLSAQDIIITFQPKADTVSIDSISATNLRTNQIVKLLGGESLLLVKTPTSINQLKSNPEMGYIYPNPTDGDATFCFSMNKSEEVEIRLYNANGQLLMQEKQNLSQGTHRYLLKFPTAGIYYLSLIKREGATGFKVVNTGRKTQNSSIVYEGIEKLNSLVSDENQFKSTTTDKSLAYTEGDIIQYSFFSGVNMTIVSDIPKSSKTIDVEFVSCIDNDNRSYKIVQIGDQRWMAENLAYLPAVSPPTTGSYTEPYYYVYGYEGADVATAKGNANYTTYGVLYNWPAAKAACPPGWHLPTDDEWKQLEMALGMTQAQADEMSWRGNDQGTQMKATSGWNNNRNGTNTSGFSALPGGSRYTNGLFDSVGDYGRWWSSTEGGSTHNAWIRALSYDYSGVSRSYSFDGYRFSVCCVRDN
jgi:uncharacterized protein (TIGR02145 family)